MMVLFKYIKRAQRIDHLIRTKATGNAASFAAKLGISRSLLMEHLHDLRELGAPIRYSEMLQTYYYETDFTLSILQD